MEKYAGKKCLSKREKNNASRGKHQRCTEGKSFFSSRKYVQIERSTGFRAKSMKEKPHLDPCLTIFIVITKLSKYQTGKVSRQCSKA